MSRVVGAQAVSGPLRESAQFPTGIKDVMAMFVVVPAITIALTWMRSGGIISHDR